MSTRTRDELSLPGYDSSEFPAFAVSRRGDPDHGRRRAPRPLVRRGQEPFEGMWATPGGFKRPDETLDEAARELSEETGVDVPSLLTQFGAYGDPGRDPRMNVVTVGYLAVLRDVGAIAAGTDAAHAALVPLGDPRGAGRARVRPSADRPRRGRARPSSSRSRASRRRSSARPSRWRSSGRLRGDLGRAARRCELPPQPRGRGRLGDPDGPDGALRAVEAEARRALPGRPGVEARRRSNVQPTDERK